MCYNYVMEKKENSTNLEYEAEIKKGLEELYGIIADIHDPQLVEDFLGCLLTPSERKDIAARWLLVKEINNGTSQREIAKKFNMSLCKITRGSKELKKPDSAFWKILHKK